MASAFVPTASSIIGAGVGAVVSEVFGEQVTLIFSEALSKGVVIDANIEESFRTSASVTEHPVEDGSNVADHVKDEPDELRIRAIISNTPVMLLASARVSSTRAEDDYEDLLALKAGKLPVGVYTPKRDYENMLITSVERQRTAGLGDSVEASITLRKITTVESKIVSVPRPPGVQKAKRAAGRKAKKAADTAQSASLLSKLGAWLGG